MVGVLFARPPYFGKIKFGFCKFAEFGGWKSDNFACWFVRLLHFLKVF